MHIRSSCVVGGRRLVVSIRCGEASGLQRLKGMG